MAATHEELLLRFMREAGRAEPHFLHRSGNLFVTKDGVLYYDREGHGRMAWGYRRRNSGPARNLLLAQFIGDRYGGGCMLLNGDGFEDDTATGWQETVRRQAHAEFGWQRCPIIPFMATRAAEIDHSTIKVIEVTAERNDNRIREGYPDYWEEVMTPNMKTSDGFFNYAIGHDMMLEKEWTLTAGTRGSSALTYQGRHKGELIQIGLTRYSGNSYSLNVVNIMAQPENGRRAWQRMARNGIHGCYWTEMIHRLGASVFYGGREGERRHRWVSAFDMNEPEPLYFLAQLPDRGVCKGYEDALTLLAPEIVHQAKSQGRSVERQGDVFAIETNLTDETVYKNAVTRVRRAVAFQDEGAVHRAGGKLMEVGEGEVRERGTCPMCNCKPWVGNGPAARRALMIHRTGHTADEVVVKPNGSIFIRGNMYHDPQLEETGRRPDHRPVALLAADGREHAWFLAVRNTVPRQRPRRQTVIDANETQQGHAEIERLDRAEAAAA